MDGAFERRFLYKIEFDKPNLENKINLWKHMLQLNDQDAELLARKYDFTGAQIENIYRKKMTNTVLYGDIYNIDKLIEFCEQEKLGEQNKKIGFLS